MKKSQGTPVNEYGKKTADKVCGGELCGENKITLKEKGMKKESVKMAKKFLENAKATNFMKTFYKLG